MFSNYTPVNRIDSGFEGSFLRFWSQMSGYVGNIYKKFYTAENLRIYTYTSDPTLEPTLTNHASREQKL